VKSHSEIWCFHDGEDLSCDILDYYTMYSGRYQHFKEHSASYLEGVKNVLKYLYPSTILHGIRTEKTTKSDHGVNHDGKFRTKLSKY
jgi:hypothetical protein